MEQWELHEYASPIGTFFIKVAGSGRVIASSLKCGRDRAALIAAAPELLETLQAVRDNLVRLAWTENSIMVEGIDKVLAKVKAAS